MKIVGAASARAFAKSLAMSVLIEAADLLGGGAAPRVRVALAAANDIIPPLRIMRCSASSIPDGCTAVSPLQFLSDFPWTCALNGRFS